MYDHIYPGKPWYDTSGKRIQAHGGSILAEGGTFYWYGENKEKTIGTAEIWHWGVRCYSSKDLMNWEDLGLIIPPEPDHPESPLHPSKFMDRPHILYNEKTGSYVAWLKMMGDGRLPAHFAVFTAAAITGPYRPAGLVNPFGFEIGDFDLAKDPDTGKAYLFSQKPHTSIFICALDESYTNVEGECTEHFPHTAPPDSREAPAHFFRHGKHYLITSGTTGYYPNPSEAAVADSWQGPYTVLGNPHPGDKSLLSFNSQISSVFRHPLKKDLYIALADRWKPEISRLSDAGTADGTYSVEIREKFRRIFDPDGGYVFTPGDAKDLYINSSVSDYVWLPIRFEEERPVIDWRDAWSPEEFA